ncbi:uncharacterized protein LOC127783547 isoform X2 [Oryza glaberrima]|uniref:uncharacterized protein LOC127783547 isoform X2 n=1 Tax=Oryza glaberrima TaxID=4538 RepID=UPI00224C2E9D|nr:uncharacterized protein LOC127783547 isoform X2 [Oryza glaberrima]
MASSSLLLRSAARELRRRRSIFRPPRLAAPPVEPGSRLLTTDGAAKNTTPPSSSTPNATQFQLHRLEDALALRSEYAHCVETIKVCRDEVIAYKRYLLKKKKESDLDYLLTLDQFSDTMEEWSSILRQTKEVLEAKNKESAEMYRLVRQRALLSSYSAVFAVALYNLYLFS